MSLLRPVDSHSVGYSARRASYHDTPPDGYPTIIAGYLGRMLLRPAAIPPLAVGIQSEGYSVNRLSFHYRLVSIKYGTAPGRDPAICGGASVFSRPIALTGFVAKPFLPYIRSSRFYKIASPSGLTVLPFLHFPSNSTT